MSFMRYRKKILSIVKLNPGFYRFTSDKTIKTESKKIVVNFAISFIFSAIEKGMEGFLW